MIYQIITINKIILSLIRFVESNSCMGEDYIIILKEMQNVNYINIHYMFSVFDRLKFVISSVVCWQIKSFLGDSLVVQLQPGPNHNAAHCKVKLKLFGKL